MGLSVSPRITLENQCLLVWVVSDPMDRFSDRGLSAGSFIWTMMAEYKSEGLNEMDGAQTQG